MANKKARNIIIQLVCSFALLPVTFSPAEEQGLSTNNSNGNALFYEANSRYKEGNYKEAITLYEEPIKKNWESGPLYYNLGNAYFKTGQKGKAILNYLRAQRLMPRDPDLRSNLSYACSLVKGGQIPVAGNWFVLRWKMLCEYLTINESAYLMSLFYLLFIALVIISVRNISLRKPLKYFIISSLCLFILLIGVFIVQIRREIQPVSVVISRDVPVRFEPAEDATIYYHLYEGHAVDILKESGQWCQIKRADGKSGWVKTSDIERL